jgi:hypothetical protein
MSYTIIKTNGTTLGTILDGTINTSFTSLTLIGRNYANYGEIIANDLVALVENFAFSSSPPNPLAGQLWFDTNGGGRLKVYTGSQFKVISSATVSSSQPAGAISGDLWFDTVYSQLYVYDGASFILVGPERNGSGAIWEQITDTAAVVHDVLSIKLNNARTSIISRDSEFTPASAILGYTTIKAGINANTSVGSGTFWGTANNATYLGGFLAASYLRSDEDDSTSGNLTIAKNGGLTIGLSSNLELTTTTAGGVSFKATKNNQDIDFYANVGGTNTSVLNLDGATGNATLVAASITGDLTIGDDLLVAGDLAVSGTGAFTGNLTAPTQAAGTSDTTVATTAFVVSGLSGLFPYKIYNGTTHVWTDASSVNIVVSGTTVATAGTSGFNLQNGATAVSQTIVTPTAYHQYFANTSALGNTRVATGQYVSLATQYWSGSAKFVSTAEPDNAVGKDGDFWFQREA